MFRKNALALFVTAVCTSGYSIAEDAVVLGEVNVVENAEVTTQSIQRDVIKRQQPRDVKSLLADELDVQATQLQGVRSGNESVNVRGLQGNRVAMSIDGIPLPETQENKLFVSLGMDFGRGDYIEPTSLRSAKVQHSGSAQGLSGSVSFATLTPSDVIQSGNVGGFIATGYDSVDNSIYGSVGGAAKNERYEGLVIATGRFGHESENNATVGGEGTARTQANPADYKKHYVLVKQGYKLNEQHKIGLTFEHQQKSITTDLLSTQGASIDMAVGDQISGFYDDQVRRDRFSLVHEYSNEQGWLQSAKTQLYYQNAQTDNYRNRTSTRGFRSESGSRGEKIFGFQSDFISPNDVAVQNVLRYGVAYQHNDMTYRLVRKRAIDSTNYQPSADTKQQKISAYLEDEIALGNVYITPHLGVLHYQAKPKKDGNYQQAAEEYVDVKAQNGTYFLPKFSVAWKLNSAFEPYFQYSRGINTPSSQQLSSSFGNTVVVGGRIVRQYAVVGNANLSPETANNFELGFRGKNEQISYRVSGYYNKYKNFIDFVAGSSPTYNPLIQYQNFERAKIYGVTAEAKWFIQPEIYISGGVAYAKGKAENKGVRTPINTISPLKLKAGLGYEGERFGANVLLTHTKAKADKDINGTIFNPTRSVNVVDLGVYWKPIKQLSFSAKVNNIFDEKYWNWGDISYFAVQRSSASPDRTATLNENNAETYTAPGRNFNVGVRYEF